MDEYLSVPPSPALENALRTSVYSFIYSESDAEVIGTEVHILVSDGLRRFNQRHPVIASEFALHSLHRAISDYGNERYFPMNSAHSEFRELLKTEHPYFKQLDDKIQALYAQIGEESETNKPNHISADGLSYYYNKETHDKLFAVLDEYLESVAKYSARIIQRIIPQDDLEIYKNAVKQMNDREEIATQKRLAKQSTQSLGEEIAK